MKFIAVFVFLFTTAFSTVFAQGNSFRFKHYSLGDGLSNTNITDILQDENGFIWFATPNGLNKFDGYDFTVYEHNENDSTSISSNDIKVLYEDHQQVLWVGTSQGLNTYQTNRNHFRSVNLGVSLAGLSVNDLKEDKHGNLFISSNKGLIVLDKNRNLTQHFVHDDQDDRSLSSSHTSKIIFDHKGRLWVGSRNTINLFDKKNNAFKRYKLPVIFDLENHFLVSALFEDSNHHIWASSNNNGVLIFNSSLDKFVSVETESLPKEDPLPNRIKTIYESRTGEIWFGTYGGLLIYDPVRQTDRLITHDQRDEYSLSHNAVQSILEDKRGNLWLGTIRAGINYYDKNYGIFQHYQAKGSPDQLTYNVISSFAEDLKGNIWIGAERGGLNCFDPKTEAFTHHFQKENPGVSRTQNHIKVLEADAQGNLWIASLYGGLYYFDTKAKTYTPFSDIYKGKEQTFGNISDLMIDREGKLWISSTTGIYLYNTRKNELHQFDQLDLPPSIVYVLWQCSYDQIWLGNSNERGLYKISREGVKIDSFDIPNVRSIYEDENDILWIGSGNKGLYRINLRNRALKHYPAAGQFKGRISGILEDENENLWISTLNGLVRFSKKTEQFSFFNHTDGLQGNEFREGAYFKASNGDLYFGGNNGISRFNPAHILKDSYSPQIVITDVKISGESADMLKTKAKIHELAEMELSYDRNSFSIDFAAINYSKTEKTQYAYKLEGFDDWNYIGKKRNATYTNLNEGNYVFKIKASDGNGEWTEETAGIQVRVLAAPWKTGWAYLLYFCLFAGIAWLIYMRLKLKNQLKIQEFQRVQEDELHELKYRFFTNISHELRTPLTLIIAPLEKLSSMNTGDSWMRKQLHVAQNNAERLLELVNQLLDLRKLETHHMKLQVAEGDFSTFLKEIYLSFQEHARFKQIAFTFTANSEKIDLFYDRDKLEKVLYNLLSNALKFTKAGGEVELILEDNSQISSLKYPQGFVTVKVKDTGLGISKDSQEEIFERYGQDLAGTGKASGTGIGLSLSKGLVELHKGEISVESHLNEGSVFTIRLPLGKDHLLEQDIIKDFKDSESILQYQVQKEAPTELEENEAATTNPDTAKRPRLLIVEDNEEVRQFIVDDFYKDYLIETAENGVEGLKKAFEHSPDLIISDVMMPEMNGIDLCSTLKSDLRTSHIPVILLSARTGSIFKVNGLETGADDYISKPFKPQILKVKVRNLIEGRQKLRQRFKQMANLNLTDIAVTTGDEKFLESVVKIIEEGMDDPSFNVEALSQKVGFTRVHMYRKIKALTDMSASEFVRSIRLRKAAELLRNEPFMNINEISYAVGIQDPSYFRSCFKKIYGLTPTKYKNGPSKGKEKIG